MNYDILIQGCTVLMPDFTMAKNMSVGISNGFIVAVNKMERASSDTGDIVIDGSERLLMPGLVDASSFCVAGFQMSIPCVGPDFMFPLKAVLIQMMFISVRSFAVWR